MLHQPWNLRLQFAILFFYVTTLTKEELKERLLKRGDDPEKIKERLSGSELNLLPEDLQKYAYILVNDNLSETKSKLDSIVSRLEEWFEMP